MDGMVDMKKTICILIVICLCSLSLYSCGVDYAIYNAIEIFEHRDDIIDISNGIEYNGSIYRFLGHQGDNNYYQFYDCNKKKHSGEVVAHFIDMYGSLGDVSKTCESDFGNAVLKVSGSTAHPSVYVKEGFSFPDYRILSIKSVYLADYKCPNVAYETEQQINAALKRVADYSEAENIVLMDFVDSYNSIQYDINTHHQKKCKFVADISFTLKDYSTFYCGFFSVYECEEQLYMEIDDSKNLYKVKAEYLDWFIR